MTEDLVNHPIHYEKHAITLEPIDLLETLPFAVGNCLKYIFRAKDKDSELLDLKKALFYHMPSQMATVGSICIANACTS